MTRLISRLTGHLTERTVRELDNHMRADIGLPPRDRPDRMMALRLLGLHV